MQDFFTQAAITSEIVGLGYLAGSFVLYTHRRLQASAVWVPKTQAMARSAVDRSYTAVIKTVDPVSSESKRKLSPTEELRQQCQKAGIKWRDAHGKNKHLKKAEMIEALQRLAQEQPPTPPKPTPAPAKSDGNHRAA